jgi:hypothetical protein
MSEGWLTGASEKESEGRTRCVIGATSAWSWSSLEGKLRRGTTDGQNDLRAIQYWGFHRGGTLLFLVAGVAAAALFLPAVGSLTCLSKPDAAQSRGAGRLDAPATCLCHLPPAPSQGTCCSSLQLGLRFCPFLALDCVVASTAITTRNGPSFEIAQRHPFHPSA